MARNITHLRAGQSQQVTPKKQLGQHFLTDLNIAQKIVDQLSVTTAARPVLEIGPGMGVLTRFLLERKDVELMLMDIDAESVAYLHTHFAELKDKTLLADFLKADLAKLLGSRFDIIGNFPYNISSQIFFKVLEHRQQVHEVVGMIQKEVAERLAAGPGTKVYGILSVLLQAYYTIEYCFTVSEQVFHPKPKVKSAVIKLVRNQTEQLACNEKLFFRVVKQAFQTRRKTLRNALKPLGLPPGFMADPILDKRAEQLSVLDFVYVTNHFATDLT